MFFGFYLFEKLLTKGVHGVLATLGELAFVFRMEGECTHVEHLLDGQLEWVLLGSESLNDSRCTLGVLVQAIDDGLAVGFFNPVVQARLFRHGLLGLIVVEGCC